MSDSLAVRPSPVAVTVMPLDPSAAVGAALSVSVSLLFAALEFPAMGFADHPAITPLGSPVTLRPMAPLNDPPVATVKLTLPATPGMT